MDIRSLNEDTLDAIFTHLNSRDARKLSSTARMFHVTGRRHAVKDVTTHSFRQAVKFCDCMMHDSSDLLPWLRSLRMDLYPVSTPEPTYRIEEEEEYRAGACQIADLLHEVPNLKVLALHEAELLMVYEPRIATIISSMHFLRELELMDIGPRVSDALCRLQSTPDKMILIGCTYWPTFASAFVPRRWSARSTNISLPSVHALSLQGTRHIPRVGELARMFPNVLLLELWETKHPMQAMEYFQPVALVKVPVVGYSFLRELIAHDRNPRLRYITAEIPASLSIYAWLPQLQAMWILLQTALNRRRDIVCVKVHCSVQRSYWGPYLAEGGQQIPFGSYKHALNGVLAALPRWSTELVSLRYLSLDLRSTSWPLTSARCRVNDLQLEEDSRASNADVFWWEIDRSGEAPVVKSLSVSRGEQISDFLCSPRYDWRVDLDAQSF